MECPRGDGVLEVHEIGPVKLSRCVSCHGTWFAEGELERARDAFDPDLRWIDIDLWKEVDRFKLSVSDRTCPVDRIPMVQMEYGDTGVVIDHCLRCNGIFLDQGEFRRILKALEQDALGTPSSEYARETLEEAGDIIAGPEGIASEWRDFLTVARLMQYRILSENPRLRDVLLAYYRSSPFK